MTDLLDFSDLDLEALTWPELAGLLDPPETLLPSEWALKYRVLPGKGQAEPGPWRHRAKYLVEIMDAAAEPHVQEVTVMKSPQTGGSEAMLNVLGWAMTTDPDPTAYVMPTEDSVKDFLRERVANLVQLSTHPAFGPWREAVGADEAAAKKIKGMKVDMPEMTLYAIWAGSPMALASRAIRRLFLDELDKFPTGKKEAHPEDLAVKRTTTFRKRRLVYRVSTPTVETGRIYLAYKRGDQRERYVPCPHCGAYQVIRISSLFAERGATVDDIANGVAPVWMRCEVCRERIEERQRDGMDERGVWVPQGCEVDDDGVVHGDTMSVHRSYHIWAAYSPWVPWSEILSEHLACEGDPEKRQDVANGYFGQPFFEVATKVDLEAISSETSDFKLNDLPESTSVVVMAADVQSGPEVWWVAMAVTPEDHLYLLDYGTLFGDDAFDQYLTLAQTRTWAFQDGSSIGVSLAAIDHESGLFTHDVEMLGHENRDLIMLVSGQQRLKGGPIKRGNCDPRGRRGMDHLKIPLYSLDTTMIKDRAARMLGASDDARRSVIHIPRDVSEEFISHVTSEHKVFSKKSKSAEPIWEKKHGSPRNEYWDCIVYAIAASMRLGSAEGALAPRSVREERKREAEERAKLSRWRDNRRGSFWGRGR
ncbi:MAG: phage terminase large subunit family protein [Planctomycetes bacterium]|nr:phage terminase large subunit family protein [Planctomycetota bacterium]